MYLFEFGGSEVCVPCGKCAVVVNMHQIGFVFDFLKCSGLHTSEPSWQNILLVHLWSEVVSQLV